MGIKDWLDKRKTDNLIKEQANWNDIIANKYVCLMPVVSAHT